MVYHLERMLWQKVRELVPEKIDTIILPVGTMEAHGAACLGTDVFIPVDIGEYVAEKFNFILAPPVWYGITRSLLSYAGSLTIEPDNFRLYILDLLKSFGRHDFRKVIILNGHGGNNSILKDCASVGFREYGLKVAVIHWWIMCSEITKEVYGQEGGHAGIDETGYVVSIDPGLANKEYYSDDLVYENIPATDVYPAPGTILLYNDKGEGKPDFDYEKGKVYSVKVKEMVAGAIKSIIRGWDINSK